MSEVQNEGQELNTANVLHQIKEAFQVKITQCPTAIAPGAGKFHIREEAMERMREEKRAYEARTSGQEMSSLGK